MDSAAKAWTRVTGMIGFAILLLLIFLVPIFFVPPGIGNVSLVSAEIQFYKEVAIRFLCAALLLVTIVHQFGVGFKWFGRVALGYVLAVAFVGISLLSVALSDSPTFSFRQYQTELMLWLAILVAPLYLTNMARLRAMLIGATASAAVVALIAIFSMLGFTKPYEFIYGADPVTIARQGLQEEMGRVEGGAARAAAQSTLGNPEYSGNFFAGGILLAGCWLLDGFGSRRLRSLAGWIVGLIIFALLSAAMLQTQTRSAFLVILAGLIVRWIAGLPLRGWVIALWLLATLAAGFLLGLRGAAAVFVLGLAVLLAWQLATKRFLPQWKSVPLRSRVLLATVPFAVVGVLVAAIAFEPVRLRMKPLGERFASALSTQDRSVRERLIFYMMAGEMLKDHPVLGVGPGFFPAYYHEAMAQIVESDPSGVMAYNQILLEEWLAHETHNDYFQLASERGLPGILLFLGVLTWLLRGIVGIVRGRDPEFAPVAQALAVVLCGYCAMMMFSFPLHEAARTVTFHMLLAAALSIIGFAKTTEVTERYNNENTEGN